MKRNIAIFILFSLLICGCGSMPSVCDTMEEPSMLCDMADKLNVRLEDVGNTLILVNTVLIVKGVYSNSDAREVLTGLSNSLDSPISYALFRAGIYDALEDYPGLILVAESYLKQFTDQFEIIYEADRNMLQAWLAVQISLLG